MQQVPQPPISKFSTFYCVASFFSKENLNPQVRIDKIKSERSVVYHLILWRLTSKNSSSHIFIDLLGVYLPLEFLLNLLSNLYRPQLLGKSFKFMVFRILENAFLSRNFESRNFHSCPKPKQPTDPPIPHHPLEVLIIYPKTEAAIFENLLPQQKDTSQMICKVNQSTGFYMMALLALNGLTD